MTTPEITEQLRQIKQMLRSVMNGPVSQSMRAKGMPHKVIFGVELPRLQELASELPHTQDLAVALWKEDIRECRLLAGMVAPSAGFPEDLADLWVEQIRHPEEADGLVLHLLQQQPYASSKVFQWMANENASVRYTAYQLLNRLLMQGKRLTTRDGFEFLDQAKSDLLSKNQNLQVAAYKALLRYMDCGIGEERMGEQVLKAFEEGNQSVN